jgi:hypothetical protein
MPIDFYWLLYGKKQSDYSIPLSFLKKQIYSYNKRITKSNWVLCQNLDSE